MSPVKSNDQLIKKVISSLKFFSTETAVENVPSPHILLASVYRAIGIVNCSEAEAVNNWHKVAPNGKWEFNNNTFKLDKIDLTDIIATTFDVTVDKTPYMFPVIPELAYFGQAVRYGKNTKPMNPGNYFLQIIYNYSIDNKSFMCLVEDLFDALKVSDKDKIEKFFSKEFEDVCDNYGFDRNIPFDSQKIKSKYNNKMSFYRNLSGSLIAKSCIKDLCSLIELKSKNILHQQWLGLFEGFLRLTLFNHTICSLNLSKSLFNIIVKSKKIDQIEFDNLFSYDVSSPLKLGVKQKDYVKERIESHFDHNIRIMWLFEESNIDLESKINTLLDCNLIISKISSSITPDINEFIQKKTQENLDVFYERSENSSSLKNKKEFLEHVLRDRSDQTKKGTYLNDVNYLFRKIAAKNSPFVVDIGPGMIILLTTLIFMKQHNSSLSRISSKTFLEYLNQYNFSLTLNDLSRSSLSSLLMSLGYIIDSPDNEGGIMIIKPLIAI